MLTKRIAKLEQAQAAHKRAERCDTCRTWQWPILIDWGDDAPGWERIKPPPEHTEQCPDCGYKPEGMVTIRVIYAQDAIQGRTD